MMHMEITLASIIESRLFLTFIRWIKLLRAGKRAKKDVKDSKVQSSLKRNLLLAPLITIVIIVMNNFGDNTHNNIDNNYKIFHKCV